jgi:hypothetical protein
LDSYFIWWHMPMKNITKREYLWAPVAHTYSPSYSGGRDQEDHSSKPAWANSSWDPISKTKAGGMGLREVRTEQPWKCRVSAWKRGGQGEREGAWERGCRGKGRGMTQTLYPHMNKRNLKKKM